MTIGTLSVVGCYNWYSEQGVQAGEHPDLTSFAAKPPIKRKCIDIATVWYLIMAALWNRAGHYIFALLTIDYS